MAIIIMICFMYYLNREPEAFFENQTEHKIMKSNSLKGKAMIEIGRLCLNVDPKTHHGNKMHCINNNQA